MYVCVSIQSAREQDVLQSCQDRKKTRAILRLGQSLHFFSPHVFQYALTKFGISHSFFPGVPPKKSGVSLEFMSIFRIR